MGFINYFSTWFNDYDSKQMLFVLIASLISFWPYVGGYHLTILEQSDLRHTLENNDMNKCAAISAISLMVPLFMDWLSDIVANRKSIKVNNTFLLYHMEKIVLYGGLLSVPSLAFVSPLYEDLSLLWFCMTRFQIVSVLGTLMVTFNRVNNYAWSLWISLLSTTILTIGCNLGLYGSLVKSNALHIVDLSIKVVLLALYLFSIIRWLFRPNFSKSFASLYLRIGTSSYAMIIIVLMVTGPKEHLTPNMLLLYNAAFIGLTLGILYYKMRRTKYERFHDILGLIESRKQYLRYVAHEIRTPLNSACLGTTLLVDALASIEEKDDFDEVTFVTTSFNLFLTIIYHIIYSP